MQYTKKVHKAFSLVELVIAILIISVLVATAFAGGNVIIKNAQISRTLSDLHNFQIATELTLNEIPTCINIVNNDLSTNNGMKLVVDELSKNLAEDYRFNAGSPLATISKNNILIQADNSFTDGKYLVFESEKRDAWNNPYYIIFDCGSISHNNSEFTIIVRSAGPNSISKIGYKSTGMDPDDIILRTNYTDGIVSSKTINIAIEANKETGIEWGGDVFLPANGKNLYDINSPLRFSIHTYNARYPGKLINGIYYSGAAYADRSECDIPVRVIPGKTYTISADFIEGVGLTGAVAVDFIKNVNPITSIGARVSTQTCNPDLLIPEHISYSFDVPAGAEYAVFHFGAYFKLGNYKVGAINIQMEKKVTRG